jgi:hypothetical protein
MELLATTSYYSVSNVSLALFLYKLLNPESHSVPITDAESTNPVEGDLPSASADEPDAAPRTRRVGDRTHLSSPEEKAALAENLLQLMSPAESPTGEKTQRSAAADQLVAVSRRTRAVFGAAAVLIFLAIGFWTTSRGTPAASSMPVASNALVHTASPQPAEAPATPTLAPTMALAMPERPEPRAARWASTSAHARDRRSKVKRSAGPATESGLVPAAQGSPEERRSAQGLRFEAGMARVEAERLEAHELASSEFAEARSREREGEELFLLQSYQRALAAFDRAAGLYRLAENISRERRVERVKIASD